MRQRHDAYPELERDLRFRPLGVEAPSVLTPAQIESYNANGYLFPIDIFHADEIAEIRSYFDDLLSKAVAAGWDNYEIVNWHKSCAGVHDIIMTDRILNVAQDLLGDDVILRHSHFFVKLPGDGKRVSWHQDISYWPLTKSRVVTVWLAIDDVDLGNAAMQVIPGSHKTPRIPFVDSADEENNVLNQTVENPGDFGGAPVALKMKAGQISLHSDLILHSSEVNQSNRRRCGLAMRFLSPDVKAYGGWNEHSIICRGVDPDNHWADHPRPDGETIPIKQGETSLTDLVTRKVD